MNENSPAQTPPPREPSGAWRGVAGCFVTAATTLIGGVIGVAIGWKFMPPKWDRTQGGSEMHEWTDFFNSISWPVGGALVGLLVGLIAGGVASYLLFRRR